MPNLSINQKMQQQSLVAKHLKLAFDPPPEGSAVDHGWGCVARLVLYWLTYPDSVPQPPAEPLRGLVFIEEDGTVRRATKLDI